MGPRAPTPVYGLAKKALFKMDPERAHHLAAAYLGAAHRNAALRMPLALPQAPPRLHMEVAGIRFPGPVGIAAGFDKEAGVYNALLRMGFGHVELGTVTPRGQPGNPKPRVFRFPEQQALVNAMGFPGPGADVIAANLAKHPRAGIIGANIGPNKDTAAEQVPELLSGVAAKLAPHADYVAVNVSSPNTPGLRQLQEPESVAGLIGRVLDGANGLPVFLKLHPDAPHDELVGAARAAIDAGAAGIIAVNTTRERVPGTESQPNGGLSGAPLREKACNAIAALHHGLGRDAPIIGVGGIFSGKDALDAIQAGASIVQTYTGFIYRGPRIAHLIHKELEHALDAAGFDALADAVGTA